MGRAGKGRGLFDAATVAAMQDIVRVATKKSSPLVLRKFLTVPEFAALAQVETVVARKLLKKLDKRAEGAILVNVSESWRPRYRVSMEALRAHAPELAGTDIEKAASFDKYEGLEARVRRLENRVARFTKARPELAVGASKANGWLTPSQMGALLGLPTRTVGQIITSLGLRGDLPGICEPVSQYERDRAIKLGDRPDCGQVWIAYRYSEAAFKRIRTAVDEAP